MLDSQVPFRVGTTVEVSDRQPAEVGAVGRLAPVRPTLVYYILVVTPVVRGFLGDGHIVRVALAQARA